MQQNYRPIIAVHRWFARRPGTLFRGLLLSEFSDDPLREAFYNSNAFPTAEMEMPTSSISCGGKRWNARVADDKSTFFQAISFPPIQGIRKMFFYVLPVGK